MKKTILVTGGAGFIGSHLCEQILKRGDRVVVIDNFNRYYPPAIKQQNLASFKSNPAFTLFTGDILDKKLLKNVFEKHQFDVVVHLAARAGVRPSLENPKLYAEVNVAGTALLLEELRQAGVRQLILASSSSVYGNRTQGPFKETDLTDNQISPYGATKKASEMLAHVYAHLYGIQTTVLRFFTAYGPRNRPDMAMFQFMQALLTDKPIMQFGDGTTGRDYTYINDLVDGILAAVDKPLGFEIINLGNSQPVLLKDLITTMEQITGKKASLNQLPLQPGDVALTYADIDKARNLLKWQPQTDLRSGLTSLYQWLKGRYN